MTAKCTAFFALGNGGWSETWFLDTSTLNTASLALIQLYQARLAMCPATVTCIGRRVSIVENPSIVNAVQFSVPGTYPTARDVLNAALLWKAQATDGTRRQVWTRGVPDDQIVNGAYAGAGTFPSAAAAWEQAIINNGFSIRATDRSFLLQKVASVDGTGNLRTFAAQTWQAGDYVKFYRARDSLGRTISGVFQILTRTDAFNFILYNWTAGRTAGNVQARKYFLRLFTPASVSINKAGTRRTGRPFGQPVGRRRVVRR